jgi:hypothetical protein
VAGTKETPIKLPSPDTRGKLSLEQAISKRRSVRIGAFEDEEVQKALKLEEQFKPLYIIPIGLPV